MAELVDVADARECAVCLGELDRPCRTACGHSYCEACLRSTFKSRRPWNRGRCPLCRAAVSLYDTVDAAGGAPLERPAVSTIFGCAFLQNGRPGVAAYHFDAPDDCYISYAAAPDAWRLDSGEKLPVRKPFDSPRWDAATRTFTGVVDWSATPLHGDARWEYRMVFSDDFAVICGGEMRALDAGGRQTGAHAFPADLRYVRARAAPTTLWGAAYMQGGELGVASYHFDGPDDCYISYEAAPPGWLLDDGSRPPAAKRFESPRWDAATRTFTGVVDWSEATFGGDARWEYTIVFAEDFGAVAAGEVRAFDAAGGATDTHKFGRELHYELYVEEIAQLFHLLVPEAG